MSLIFEADLRRYLAAELVQGISVHHKSGAWALCIQLGTESVSLRRQRGGERTFKSLDKLVDFLAELGLEQLIVQLRNPGDQAEGAFTTQ
ncbi:MAG: hypothetical protein RR736_19565 [Pseudomonas sp.]|uniref:hypothetical protein n=1 Tax=Pseudomonas sp. TaxID=306 RepID=UPI002FC9D5F8